MIFEVEVYISILNNCETVIVEIEGKSEQEIRTKMLSALNSKNQFIAIGVGVFKKENVLGSCIVGARKE